MSMDDERGEKPFSESRELIAPTRKELPIVTRAKAYAQRKKTEQQARLVAAQNELGSQVLIKLGLEKQIQLAHAQLDDIDTLVDIERGKIREEFDKMQSAVRDHEAEDGRRSKRDAIADNNLAKELAESERLRLEAERRRDTVKNSDGTDKSSGNAKVEAMRRIAEERDEMIADLLKGRTEAELSEEERHTLRLIRLSAEDRKLRILEGSD